MKIVKGILYTGKELNENAKFKIHVAAVRAKNIYNFGPEPYNCGWPDIEHNRLKLI